MGDILFKITNWKEPNLLRRELYSNWKKPEKLYLKNTLEEPFVVKNKLKGIRGLEIFSCHSPFKILIERV